MNPEYDFKCPHCGFSCSIRMSMTIVSNAKIWCEECGAQMVRVFVPISAVFKGTGFYKTDNRKKRENVRSSGTDKDGAGDSGN